MSKKAVTLYLDEECISELKSRNYNISYLCNKTLETYINEDFDDVAIAAKLAAMEERIADLKLTMEHKFVEYELSKVLYEKEIKRSEEFKLECLEARKTLILSRIIRELNSNIIAVDFNIVGVEASCKELIKRINELSPYFDLATHITRLKNVLS